MQGQSNLSHHLLQWQSFLLDEIDYYRLLCCEFLFRRHDKNIPCIVSGMFLVAVINSYVTPLNVTFKIGRRVWHSSQTALDFGFVGVEGVIKVAVAAIDIQVNKILHMA